MKRFLLVHGDSAAGNLKASGTTQRGPDRIQAIAESLTSGLIPSIADLTEFYRERHKVPIDPEDDWSNTGAALEACLAEATAFDRLELWFGPRPDSQLALAQIISAIANRPELLAMTVLVPLSKDLGQQPFQWTAAQTFEFLALDSRLVAAGASAWAAWSAPDPLAWRALMDADSPLPYFAPVVPRLLAELPDHTTGLTLTQMRLLELSAKDDVRAVEILSDWEYWSRDGVLPYWQLGQVFLDMFHGPAPLLGGIQEQRFILAIHDDRERHKAWSSSRIVLTPHGEQVLAGAADHARIAPIDFFWGGTHITNQNLWRWNPAVQALVPP